jgi:hypothetical protein
MRGASVSPPSPKAEARSESPAARATRWEPPRFEVIPLDCEITAYAPAGDEPLF